MQVSLGMHMYIPNIVMQCDTHYRRQQCIDVHSCMYAFEQELNPYFEIIIIDASDAAWVL